MNRKYKLAVRVIVVAGAIVLLKALISMYVNFSISISSLFLSFLGGAIFLMGFMLSGVSGDYKESEKLPSEIASTIENMLEEGRYVKALNKKFNLQKYQKTLGQIITDFKSDIQTKHLRKKSLSTVSRISDSLLEMEGLKVQKDSINKIKSHMDSLKKGILRVYYIKGTSFVPAAYAVLEILTASIIFMMLFLKLDGGFIESFVVPGLTSFFLLYMTFLIKDMDDPFDTEDSYVAIDLFLLDDLKGKIEKGG